MKKLLTIATLFCLCGMINAQPIKDNDVVMPPPPPAEAKDIPVFTVVEQMPEFPGGEDAMLKFLAKNVRYPEVARDCGCQGTVFITFIVDEEGNVIQPRILRAIKGCEDLQPGEKLKPGEENPCESSSNTISSESIRVIKSMPKWVPGTQAGKPVRVQYNLPLKFTLR